MSKLIGLLLSLLMLLGVYAAGGVAQGVAPVASVAPVVKAPAVTESREEAPTMQAAQVAPAAPVVERDTAETSVVDSGKCGDYVTWVLDSDGVLTISGEGKIEDYSSTSDAPWYDYRSSITSAVIESSVTSIGDWAFFDCSSLAHVTYGGTEAQWNEISIGDYNDCLTRATIHYGEVPTVTCDLNGDSTIDSADLQILARYMAGIEAIVEPAKLTAADINHDGRIDAVDLSTLAEFLAK